MADLPTAQLLQQAIADHRAGELSAAQDGYRRVLEREPRNVDALHLLGVAAGMSGEIQAAVELIGRAAAIQPDNPDILSNFGNALRQAAQIQRAADCYLRVAELRPHDVEPLLEAGSLLHQLRHYERALDVLRKAEAMASQRADVHREIGITLHQLSRHHEAIEECRKALAIAPDDVRALAHLAMSLRNVGQHDESILWAKKILDLGEAAPPEYRALALENLDRAEEAIAEYRVAIALNPSAVLFYHNLGSLLQQRGESDAAMHCYEKALALAPQLPLLHLDRALALLLKGKFEEGWKEYEWRWSCIERHAAKRQFPQQLWRDQPIAGKRLFLWNEQGLGDAIQFMRYAPLAAARGAKVILQVQPELVSLTQTLEGIEEIVPAGRFGPRPQFDLQAPLLDLPLIFSTTLDTVPAQIPYLHAQPEKIAAWVDRLAKDEPTGRPALRVGLAWSGRPAFAFDRSRSMRLADLAPLSRCGQRISYISLQKGPAAEQLQDPPPGLDVRNYADDLRDFSDTAAALENLDLLIVVDTSVAHLSGALGRPTWLLLPIGPDWRWMEVREDTPWYPTMRLFRQTKWRNWTDVVERVADELVKKAMTASS